MLPRLLCFVLVCWGLALYLDADTMPPDSAVVLSLMLINTNSYTIAILGVHIVASCMLHAKCVLSSQLHRVAADCRSISLCSMVSSMQSQMPSQAHV